MRTFILSIFILGNAFAATSQSTWRFYLAFEDAVNAKDTIWCVWDSSGTFTNVEPWLGDTAVAMNSSMFNVWIFNPEFDSTKTFAIGYDIDVMAFEIYAFGYQYPITISWDTALFRSGVLPETVDYATFYNDYFHSNWNNPNIPNYFDLTIDNHAIAPWFPFGPQDHFPLSLNIEMGKYTGIASVNKTPSVKVFPNPVTTLLNVVSEIEVLELHIHSCIGQLQFKYKPTQTQSQFYNVSTETLPGGCYIVSLFLRNGESTNKIFIKD